MNDKEFCTYLLEHSLVLEKVLQDTLNELERLAVAHPEDTKIENLMEAILGLGSVRFSKPLTLKLSDYRARRHRRRGGA
jgi:hypothetical protein